MFLHIHLVFSKLNVCSIPPRKLWTSLVGMGGIEQMFMKLSMKNTRLQKVNQYDLGVI